MHIRTCMQTYFGIYIYIYIPMINVSRKLVLSKFLNGDVFCTDSLSFNLLGLPQSSALFPSVISLSVIYWPLTSHIVWISKTGCSAVPYGNQGRAEIPCELRRKKCVGIRKLYCDGNFRPQRSVGESSQQRCVTPPKRWQPALYQPPVKDHEELRL